MEKNRMEIVGMERNSEWKIERKEENGWNIQEIKQKIRKRRHCHSGTQRTLEILVEQETSDTKLSQVKDRCVLSGQGRGGISDSG